MNSASKLVGSQVLKHNFAPSPASDSSEAADRAFESFGDALGAQSSKNASGLKAPLSSASAFTHTHSRRKQHGIQTAMQGPGPQHAPDPRLFSSYNQSKPAEPKPVLLGTHGPKENKRSPHETCPYSYTLKRLETSKPPC